MIFGSVLLMAAFILAITGCKKDNSSNSEQTKAEMLQGKWEIVTFTLSGIDQLHMEENGTFDCDNGETIPYTITYAMDPYYWNFSSNQNWSSQYHIFEHNFDMNASNVNCVATYVDFETDGGESGTWSFNYNESQIKLMVNEVQGKWNIESLTPTNMHLILDGGTSQHMYLEKR